MPYPTTTQRRGKTPPLQVRNVGPLHGVGLIGLWGPVLVISWNFHYRKTAVQRPKDFFTRYGAGGNIAPEWSSGVAQEGDLGTDATVLRRMLIECLIDTLNRSWQRSITLARHHSGGFLFCCRFEHNRFGDQPC